MIRRPPRSTLDRSSAASDVYKRQRDGAAKTRAIEVIKALGTQNVFVGSDSGLVGTPNHPDALAMAIKALRAAGFSESELNKMFKETPARLVGLPVQQAATR